MAWELHKWRDQKAIFAHQNRTSFGTFTFLWWRHNWLCNPAEDVIIDFAIVTRVRQKRYTTRYTSILFTAIFRAGRVRKCLSNKLLGIYHEDLMISVRGYTLIIPLDKIYDIVLSEDDWIQLSNIYSLLFFEISEFFLMQKFVSISWHSLQWRHNGRDSVSNHQLHDCLLSRLFRHRLKKTSKLRVTGLCEFTGDRWIPRTNVQ